MMKATGIIYPVGNSSIILLQNSNQSPNIVCAFLLILLVLTLILNSFLLLTIFRSPFRLTPYNAFLACISGASITDGIFNATSSVVFHSSWLELLGQYGENSVRIMCRANAAALQVTGMIQSFSLAAMAFDHRATILKFSGKQFGDSENEARKKKMQKGLKRIIPLSLSIALILASPVAAGLFPSVLFEQRMSCSPVHASEDRTKMLVAVTIPIFYVFLWSYMLGSSFTVIKNLVMERRHLFDLQIVARERAAERGNTPVSVTNLKYGLQNQVWGSSGSVAGDERHRCILSGLLIASFIMSVVPHIIYVQMTQFYNGYDDSQYIFPLSNNTLIANDLKPVRTDIFDSIFTWTRFGFNIFSPALILLMHNEIRKQCINAFCDCCSSEKSTSLSMNGSVSFCVKERKRETKTIVDYRVPVLFAASQGLHLGTAREDDGAFNEESMFVVKFCDLTANEGVKYPGRELRKMIKSSHRFSEQGDNEEIACSSKTIKLNKTFVIERENSVRN